MRTLGSNFSMTRNDSGGKVMQYIMYITLDIRLCRSHVGSLY